MGDTMPKHGESARRSKEEKMVERLKKAGKKPTGKDIPDLINQTLKTKHQVYLATDWHLWKRYMKNDAACHKRSDFKKVINTIESTLKRGDLLINLGDLVDGEFQMKDELKEVLLNICCNKVLVRGNNDLFDKSFYLSCGFLDCVDSFVWKDILFTHMPVKNEYDLNIHGHIHGYRQYWIPYTNQIDVAAYGGRIKPVLLDEVIKAQPAYAKTIKECPEHFNEQELFDTDLSMFMKVMEEGSSFVHDPWYD